MGPVVYVCSMRLFLDAQLLLHLGGVSEEHVELHDVLPVGDSSVGFVSINLTLKCVHIVGLDCLPVLHGGRKDPEIHRGKSSHIE